MWRQEVAKERPLKKLAGTLMLNFCPQNHEEIDFSCLSYPVHSTFVMAALAKQYRDMVVCLLRDISNELSPPCRVITSPYSGNSSVPTSHSIHVTMVATLMFLCDLAKLASLARQTVEQLISLEAGIWSKTALSGPFPGIFYRNERT